MSAAAQTISFNHTRRGELTASCRAWTSRMAITAEQTRGEFFERLLLARIKPRPNQTYHEQREANFRKQITDHRIDRAPTEPTDVRYFGGACKQISARGYLSGRIDYRADSGVGDAHHRRMRLDRAHRRHRQ